MVTVDTKIWIISGGNWKFGLKDLAISSGKTGISTKYPLEGKDYFHANNCDTHNAYHQAMTKGAKMLDKDPKPKPTGGESLHNLRLEENNSIAF